MPLTPIGATLIGVSKVTKADFRAFEKPFRKLARFFFCQRNGTTVFLVAMPKRGAPALMASVMKDGAKWP